MLKASASSIEFTSIYSKIHDGTDDVAPYAYFLEIDSFKILLDCGWNESYDAKYLSALFPFVHSAQLILISSPEMRACGALPFVMENTSPDTIVVATSATSKMALETSLQAFLYQYTNTLELHADVKSFRLNEEKIRSAFRRVKEPYGNRVQVRRNDREINCECMFANRVFGVESWIISYQIDKILYCPDYSLNLSHVLRSFNAPTDCNIVLLSAITRRTILDCSSNTVGVNKKEKKSFSDDLDQAFRLIQNTLRGGGDVLVPVNLAGRGLEVVSTLARLLQLKSGNMYKVVMAALHVREILYSVTAMTEVLQDNIIIGDDNPFSNIVTCQSTEEILQVTGPKIVFAEGETLDYGIAGELLAHFLPFTTEGAQNMILITSPTAHNTNCNQLLEFASSKETFKAENAQVYSTEGSDVSTILTNANNRYNSINSVDNIQVSAQVEDASVFSFCVKNRVRLSEEELEQYYLDLQNDIATREEHLTYKSVFQLEPTQNGSNRRAITESSTNVSDHFSNHVITNWEIGADSSSDDDIVAIDNEELDHKQDKTNNVNNKILNTSTSTKTTNKSNENNTVTSANATDKTREPIRSTNTPGLVLPPYACYQSRHLEFPVLSNAERLLESEEHAYGIPVSDEEQFIWQQRAPVRQISDSGPSSIDLHTTGTSQTSESSSSSVPFKIEVVKHILECHCKVVFCDLTGYPDLISLKTILKSKFTFAKKLVLLRSGLNNYKNILNFCRNEVSMHCGGDNGRVLHTSRVSRSIELAEPVYSYLVRLDNTITQQLPLTLKRVRSSYFTNHINSYNYDDSTNRGSNVMTSTQQYTKSTEAGTNGYNIYDDRRKINTSIKTEYLFQSNNAANRNQDLNSNHSWEVGWVNGALHSSYVNLREGEISRDKDKSKMKLEEFENKEMLDHSVNATNAKDVPTQKESNNNKELLHNDSKTLEGIDNIASNESKNVDYLSSRKESEQQEQQLQQQEYYEEEENQRKSLNTHINKLYTSNTVNEAKEMTLRALSEKEIERCAEKRDRSGLERGSFFLGTCDLNRLRETSWQESSIGSYFYRKAPLLVYDDGMCVRRSNDGTVTLSGIANPEIFTLRRAVYHQFEQIL